MYTELKASIFLNRCLGITTAVVMALRGIKFVYSPRGTKYSVACIALLILPGFKGSLSRNSAHILYKLTSTVDSEYIYDIAVHHIHTNTFYSPIYDVKMTCQHYENYIKKVKQHICSLAT